MLEVHIIIVYTVEPPNKGHIGTKSFVLYKEVSFIRRLKCTGIIGIGTSRFVLYREVFFIWSVLYRRYMYINHKSLQGTCSKQREKRREGNVRAHCGGIDGDVSRRLLAQLVM